MKITSRMSRLAADALRELETRPHVLGVASDSRDRLTVLLEQDDEPARRAAERWAEQHSTEISVKVIGKIVGNAV